MSDPLYDELPDLQRASASQRIGGIDFVLKSVDNDGNYGVDEIIKMGEKIPLNDHLHDHKPVLDGEVMDDGSVAVGCDVCPVGWYISRQEAETLGLL